MTVPCRQASSLPSRLLEQTGATHNIQFRAEAGFL